MSSSQKLPRHKKVMLVIGGIGFVLAFTSFFLHVLERVMSGHGLDTYHSAKLVEWNYIGALITCIALAVVFVVIAGYKWRERQQRKRQGSNHAERVRV